MLTNYSENIPGSLIFGGVDKTRTVKGSRLVALQRRPHARFEVGMVAINVNDPTKVDPPGSEALVLGSVSVGLDFSNSDLEFPHNVCEHLRQKLGMHWNETLGRYTVNDTRHNELIASNAGISLTLVDGNGPHVAY